MRKLLFLFCFAALLGSTGKLHAQTDTLPRVSDFVKEIQQAKDDGGQYCILLWMPWQYWETALLQGLKGKPLPPAYQDMITSMKQYNIFGVIDAKITPYGLVYANEQTVRDSSVMIANDSVKLKPLDPKDYPQQIRDLLTLLEPTIKQMLGQMGENLTIVVFPNVDAKGKTYVDARKDCKFEMHWRNDFLFTWRLPLDVLTAPKYCPHDNEKLSGKFIYSPYHGNKLEPKPVQPKK